MYLYNILPPYATATLIFHYQSSITNYKYINQHYVFLCNLQITFFVRVVIYTARQIVSWVLRLSRAVLFVFQDALIITSASGILLN